MHLLICSKISIPEKDRTLPVWEYTRSLGHTVTVEHPGSVATKLAPDAIISMGVTIMEETFEALKKWPSVPLYCYNWDCYEWVWTNPRPGEYDYKRYGELLRQSREVWVPSRCTGLRTKQWWGLDNWHVILSACPWWDYDDVTDQGYALCPLREIPDPHWDWFERACKELSILYRMTRHECTYEEYQEAVAHCRFLVSHFYEASTGGLTIMEGYYLGKLSLLSDSPYHGGRDYMGNRAVYFDHTDYEDFKAKLQAMYANPSVPASKKARRFIVDNFSDMRMVDDMLARIETCAR